MDELVAKYGWKKVAWGLVVLAILGLTFVVFSFSSIDKDANEAQKIQSQKNSTSNSGNSPANNDLKKYEAKYFTVSYPAELSVAPFTQKGDILESVQFKKESNDTTVEITAFKPQADALNYQQLYKSQGFSESEYAHPVGKVTEYKGTIGDTFHQRVDFLKKGNTVIRFMGTYNSSSTDQATEQLFSDMFMSIR